MGAWHGSLGLTVRGNPAGSGVGGLHAGAGQSTR